MEIAHVVAVITATAMIWFRIKKLRPHVCGDLLCFAAVFFCLILMDVTDMQRILTYSILAVIITHLCARFYDLNKMLNTDDGKTISAAPETGTSQPQQTAAAPNNPQPQQTTTAPNSPRVQQTLKDCLRCGKALHGAKCRHCGFDYIAEPVYMLCLVPPQKLQIQIDDET